MTLPWLAYTGNAGAGASAPGTGVMVDTTTAASRVTMDQVAGNDGTSMTLLLSEACGTQIGAQQAYWNGPGGTGFPGALPLSNQTPIFGLVSSSGTTVPKVINSGTLGSNLSGYPNMPSSQHPGSVVAAFCDGRTASLNDSLSTNVYAQLLSWSHTTGTGTPGSPNDKYRNWSPQSPLNQGDY
jgi:hypothetical protein